MNVSAYRSVISTLEKKTQLFDPTFVATREGQYGQQVDFNTVYGTNTLACPTVTPGLLKDTQSDVIIKLPTTGDYVGIASTSPNDTALGTGCRSVYIEGLSDLFAKQNETVATDGQNVVLTTKKFFRINRLVASSQGSNTNYAIQGMQNQVSPNIGTIYCGEKTSFTAGVPSSIYSTIQPDVGWSRQALCSFPTGYFPIMKSVAAAPGGGRMVEFSINFCFGFGQGLIKTFNWYGFQQVAALDFYIGGIYYVGGDLLVTALADGGAIPAMIKLEFMLVRNDLLTEVGAI